jgi:exosortase/archaeosortase family protein
LPTLFLSGVFVNLSSMSIGTERFHVEIAPECSGLEGAALTPGLRRESRFPRALLIAPAGVAALFPLNSVRIAVIILIGNADAQDIALGGFHSHAGWIAFNAVAVVLMLATRRMQWITVSHSGTFPSLTSDPGVAPVAKGSPSAPYLVPLLLIHGLPCGQRWI